MYIEGRNAVIEALKAGYPLERILIAQGTKSDKALDLLAKLARTQKVKVTQPARRELDELSERGAHQGVIAQAAPFAYASLGEVVATLQKRKARHELIIMLDHITDPGNLGAIVRSAEVVGAACVVVPQRRSAAVTPSAFKAAAGALAHLPLVQVVNIAQTIESLQAVGFWVAGASEHAQQIAWDAPMTGKLALVMGSEGEGLARLTQQRCDFLVKLPQAGQVGSLNVAQACTALSYEWLRQTQVTGRG